MYFLKYPQRYVCAILQRILLSHDEWQQQQQQQQQCQPQRNNNKTFSVQFNAMDVTCIVIINVVGL